MQWPWQCNDRGNEMTTARQWPPQYNDSSNTMTVAMQWLQQCNDCNNAMTATMQWPQWCNDHGNAMTMAMQWLWQPKDCKSKQPQEQTTTRANNCKSKQTASNSCKYQPITAPTDCNSNNQQLKEPTTKVNEQSINHKQWRGSSMQSWKEARKQAKQEDKKAKNLSCEIMMIQRKIEYLVLFTPFIGLTNLLVAVSIAVYQYYQVPGT